MNSLAVVGVLDALNVDMASALQSLGRLYPTAGRGKRYVLPCAGGEFTLIDDAYNANPESMRAAIRVLYASARLCRPQAATARKPLRRWASAKQRCGVR